MRAFNVKETVLRIGIEDLEKTASKTFDECLENYELKGNLRIIECKLIETHNKVTRDYYVKYYRVA